MRGRGSIPLKNGLVLGILLILVVPAVPTLWSRPVTVRSTETTNAPPQRNVTFTGDLATDFPSGPLYQNENTSAWTADNNISAFYAAYNSTYLFIGLSEIVTGNSLMLFIGDGGASSQGTFNLAGLNAWNRAITFTSPIITFAAVYFGSKNANMSGYGTYEITSPTSASNSTPTDRAIPSISDFSSQHSATEIGIPLSYVFPGGTSLWVNVSVSAFVVGSTGSWVGTGVPFSQTGQYNAGASQSTFLVNNTFQLTLKGLAPVGPKPINVAIIFNDHQPLYQMAGNDTYNLPWTEAHATAEYIEQAVLLREYPLVNITYELSGSLLYQLQNISHFSQFNDSFIEGAYIPWSSLNTTQNSSLLSSLEGDYFSIPSYVYAFGEPAASLYQQLETKWSGSVPLTAAQFEDAKVLWFLFDVSTDLVEGRLGSAWKDSTMWALHNQTSFSQADLGTILTYSQWLTGQVIPAFRDTMLGNRGGSDNTELFTSPFYHPLTPLLLTNTMNGPAGTIYKGSYSTDVLAQMNLSRDQFYQMFGEYPRGLYASEAAVSEAMIPLINESGARWTATDEWTLQQSGISAEGYGNSGATITQMENEYTPYIVQGANGTTSYVLFRDAPLSNNWAFNYGGLPTSTAVSDVLNYLKGVYSSLPESDHSQTLVTVMLDGENWMFMSPFADDGIPFLQQLYQALEENASFVHTVTPSQFLAEASSSGFPLPVLGSVATGSWNQANGLAAPYQSNPSLTQWSGYPAQTVLWQRLDAVRSRVVQFQDNLSLVQLQNLTTFDQNMTANTLEGNVTRAWYGIYNAEGSDWFFQMAPWTIASANTIPFNQTFQGDLNYSLSQLHAPLSSLTSVVVYPSSASILVGRTANFSASPTCTLGSCPAGTSYEWNLTSTAGTLNSSSGSQVTFKAGTKVGTEALFVNATLNGVTVQSSPVRIAISSTPAPTLTSVTVSPTSLTIGAGETTQPFTAAPVCSAECPQGTTFVWSLAVASLGHLNSTVGNSVTFTAGNNLSPENLTVFATLAGKTEESSPATITILPTLTSVAVSPSSASVQVGSTLFFSSTVTCLSNPCPSGVAYVWEVNSTIGTVSPSTGPSTTFTAGPEVGFAALTLRASLNGMNMTATANVTTTPVPVLISVAIVPASIFLTTGVQYSFSATLTCASGGIDLPCQSGVNLTWSLSSSSFGSLSPAAFKTEIEFTAGNVSGNVTLRVTADLNGKSVNGTAVITISPVNCSCEKSTQSYLLTVIVIAIAVAAFLIIFFLFRKRFIKAPADPILPPI